MCHCQHYHNIKVFEIGSVDGSLACLVSYMVIPEVRLGTWFSKFDGPLCRADIRTACRIVANNYNVNHYLNRFNITLYLCGAYQNVDHILFVCQTSNIGRSVFTLWGRLRWSSRKQTRFGNYNQRIHKDNRIKLKYPMCILLY